MENLNEIPKCETCGLTKKIHYISITTSGKKHPVNDKNGNKIYYCEKCDVKSKSSS